MFYLLTRAYARNTHSIYFQAAAVNNVGNPVDVFSFTSVTQLYRRRHMLRQVGVCDDALAVASGDRFGTGVLPCGG